MAIDTTIQFNDHNSYKITTPLFCYPFGVDGMSYITHSFQAYATSMLASATRAKTKFFDSTGATLNEVSHAFAVTTVFGKIEITVAVPATAKQAQLVLIQGGTDWWIAEPKSEQGETATPYNMNYQGQLSYITPNGAYFGMVTTEQIVVSGSISQPDETLDTRLVTINNGVINLSSTLSAKTTKITNEGVYTGEIAATQISTGYLSADRIQAKTLTGGKLADGTVTALQIAAGTITADKIASGTITADKINVSNLFAQNVTATGTITSLKLTSPAITGGSLNIGSGKFTVDSSGNLTATSATITGTLQAGSVVNGSLNSTTGTHTGNTTGAHTGTVNSSSIAGTLASTGGGHDGRIYSAYGSLAGVNFTSSSGRLYYDGNIGLSGSLYPAGIVSTNYSGSGNGIACPNSRMLAQGYDTSSDERLKQDIRPASSELVQDIYNLPVVEFSFKAKPEKKEIGINATDVVRKMPRRFTDIVIGTNGGYFNANYTEINMMAILAIQDLNKRVRALESA